MNGKRMSVGISLIFALNGTCMAATPPPGNLQFHGSIVEQSCMTHAGTNAKFEFNGCPTFGRAAAMKVSPIKSVADDRSAGHSSINIKLLADSGQKERYYDQQYELVDGANTPIRSGLYLITMSMP